MKKRLDETKTSMLFSQNIIWYLHDNINDRVQIIMIFF